MMLQSIRRNATLSRRTTPLQHSTFDSKNTSSTSLCPISLSRLTSPKTLILLFVLILCIFSLYLSNQIIPETSTQKPYHAKTNKNILAKSLPEIDPLIDVPSDNNTQQLLKIKSNIFTDSELSIAVQKSLNMYILRDGHDDRIEYLIGFRGERILDPSLYKQLPIRNPKQYDRDYISSPISISGWDDSHQPCEIKCIQCSHSCDVNGIRWSMENIQVSENDNTITGSTRLDSLIPVPYFSYHDFGFMQKPQTLNNKKTESTGIAAAFISNCGFPKRNNMVKNLQKYGVTVDSYGRCEHNKDEERNVGGRERTKIDLLSTHKFSLAFENSETDDYISEKFFGSLVSGAVPVYIGAPNIKFFAPDAGNKDVGGPGKPWKSNSIIWAGDFDFDAKQLAEYLLYLDANDTAYNEYVKWKYEGYSGDFKALIELTSTHTSCRQCILATDWSRYKNGETKFDETSEIFDYSDNNSNDKKIFYVRERGQYKFKLIKIESNTLKSFVRNVLQSIKPKEVNKFLENEHPNYSKIGPALYGIYHIPSKHTIHTDIAINNLPNYSELEVIFV